MKTKKLTYPEIRQMFWDQHPKFKNEYRKTWKQNQYNATIRTYWCDFVDYLMKDGQITENQAQNITL